MATHPIQIFRAIGPLWLIFWGALICLVDININRFDIAHDFVGMLLIVWGVGVLGSIRVDRGYAKMMIFVRIVAILAALRTLVEMAPGGRPQMLVLALTLVGLASMIATVVFCLAMRRLSCAADLDRAAESWKVTMILFAVIYLVPLGLFYLLGIIYLFARDSFNFNFGIGAAIVALIIFFIPIIHLLVSTMRMRRDAESRAMADRSAREDFERESL